MDLRIDNEKVKILSEKFKSVFDKNSINDTHIK